MAVRRQSRGFSRGTSAYRGVTHHPSGWSSFLLSLCRNQCSDLLPFTSVETSAVLPLSHMEFQLAPTVLHAPSLCQTALE